LKCTWKRVSKTRGDKWPIFDVNKDRKYNRKINQGFLLEKGKLGVKR